MNQCIKIAEDLRLSYKLKAKSIYVCTDGSIVISIMNMPRDVMLPNISLVWLEGTCMDYSKRVYHKSYGISELMMKYHVIQHNEVQNLYERIWSRLNNIEVIWSV